MNASAMMAAAPRFPLLRLQHFGAVDRDVLCLILLDGEVTTGRQQPYLRQPDDAIVESEREPIWVRRNDRVIGALVGKKREILYTMDRAFASGFAAQAADDPRAFWLTSPDDERYTSGVEPLTVGRKTKPYQVARVDDTYQYQAALQHTLYLKLPTPMREGRTYNLDFMAGGLEALTLIFQPRAQRSEAVHLSQVGFHPHDPYKGGFLSCWMGTAGGLAYGLPRAFELIDVDSGQAVHRGQVEAAAADGDDVSGTAVYSITFGAFQQPGTYRLYVEGVGCSYPFPIAAQAWEAAFKISVKGLYYQRSGIALEPPYSEFMRPLCFHPDNGMVIYESTAPITETGNATFVNSTAADNFEDLIARDTGRVFPTVAGGYMDAGDWDRRTQHLVAPRLLLELYEFNPAYFDRLRWNIPPDYPDLPDLLIEVLFELDFYRRLQSDDGGVRGGIESAQHPRHGECSWQESLKVYVYAPDVWTSYTYAGVAARAARILQTRAPELAALYTASALKAMEWAEANLTSVRSAPEIDSARNLAAAELYALTGASLWHGLFAETVQHGASSSAQLKEDAAWVYVNITQHPCDEPLRTRCADAVRDSADALTSLGETTAFGWTQDADRLFALGTFAVPRAINLVRGFRLTGSERYLRAILRACQTGAGANPNNICYTTGIGHVSPQRPLHVDMLFSNQAPPPGITVYGPFAAAGTWAESQERDIESFVFPPLNTYPLIERFWDIYWFPAICEYTIMETIAPNLFVWGFLASRTG